MPVGCVPLVYYELQEIGLKIFVLILLPEMTPDTPKIFFQNSSKSHRWINFEIPFHIMLPFDVTEKYKYDGSDK